MNVHHVAVLDGVGQSATWELRMEDDEGNVLCDLPWPKDYPKRASVEFLREHGFIVVTG